MDKEQIAPPFMKKPPEPTLTEPKKLDPPLITLSQRDEAKLPAKDEPRPGHRRLRRRRFTWKITGVTACSKSCGGGM